MNYTEGTATTWTLPTHIITGDPQAMTQEQREAEEVVAKDRRSVICIYCGAAVVYGTPNEMKLMRDAMIIHDAECNKNPLRLKLQAYESAVKTMTALIGMKEHSAEWDNAILHFIETIKEELEAIQ